MRCIGFQNGAGNKICALKEKKRCVRIVSILLNLQVTPQCKLNHLNDSKHFHICIFIDNFVGNRF